MQPWQPLAVYSMVPFAPVIEDGKMFDYATGKWAPARFKNYVTGEWIEGALSTDVTIPVGTLDPVLGRSYVQIAREGWGEQKSQNGGANPALSGPADTSYHLWAVAPAAKPAAGATSSDRTTDLFHNSKVAHRHQPRRPGRIWLNSNRARVARLSGLQQIDAESATVHKLERQRPIQHRCRAQAAPIYRADPRPVRTRSPPATSTPQAKAGLLFELDAKDRAVPSPRSRICSALTSSPSPPRPLASQAAVHSEAAGRRDSAQRNAGRGVPRARPRRACHG